jgi:hypothetical protein
LNLDDRYFAIDADLLESRHSAITPPVKTLAITLDLRGCIQNQYIGQRSLISTRHVHRDQASHEGMDSCINNHLISILAFLGQTEIVMSIEEMNE